MKHFAAPGLVAVLLAPLALASCGRPVDDDVDEAVNAPAAAPAAPPPAATPAPDPAPGSTVVNPPVAAPAPTTAPTTVGEFNLTGTEPFWGVRVRANTVTLSRMDHADVSAPTPRPQVTGQTIVWSARPFTVTVRPGECSDGMSDRRYAFEAEVRTGAEVLKGCAYRPGDFPRTN